MPGATTVYGFPFPVGGDPLGDGDNAIQSLAEALEAWIKLVVKAANEDVSSTTYQADDDLEFPVVAGAVYVVDFEVLWKAANDAVDGGIKARWNLPTGSKAYGHGYSQRPYDPDLVLTVAGDEWEIGTANGGEGLSAVYPYSLNGRHRIVAGDDGTARIQWAQLASHATATRVMAGSWLRVMRAG